MARKSDRDRIRQWTNRIGASEKAYQRWKARFRPDRNELYFQGQQWEDEQRDGYEPYTVNLCYPAVKTKLPSLLFYRPKYLVRPRATMTDDPGSTAEARAKLREDTLNTLIADERTGFEDETALSLFEGLVAFGVVEVGYTADFLDNPSAGKPMLDETGEEADGRLMQPDVLPPTVESLYVKRIPAAQFRVPVNAKNRLERNDWCGYYEWHYPEDLRRNKNYENTTSIKTAGALRDVPDDGGETESSRYRDMVKVWKIWDMRAKVRFVFCENGEKFLQKRPFKFLPLEALKFNEILDEWYPLPPMTNWISPQNEINETAEQKRQARMQLIERYLRIQDAINDDEFRKLEEPRHGVTAIATRTDALTPIPHSNVSSVIAQMLPATKDEFNEISGVTSEQRGMAQSETATQANILDVRSRIKETLERSQVARFLARVGKKLLMTLQESMTLPFVVKTAVDPLSMSGPVEAMGIEQTWREITLLDLGDLEYDVSVDIESMSPVTEARERQDWTNVLALLANPQLLMVLATSDALLRKTLTLHNVRSERDITEIKRIGLMMAMMAQAQAGQGGPGASAAGMSGANVGGGAAGPGATPTNQATAEQLQAQLGSGVAM